MFGYLLKKYRVWQIQNYCRREKSIHEQTENIYKQKSQIEFSKDLEKNLAVLKGIIGCSSDIVIRRFAFGSKKRIQAALVYIDGMINNT